MKRPAITRPAQDSRRRLISLGLVGLISLTVGYVGQDSWGVGSSSPAAASAIVTDVVGAGNRKPVQARVSIAVTNNGAEQIQVHPPSSPGTGSTVRNAFPRDLLVAAGAIGRLEVNVTLACDLPEPPQLPDLSLELRNGARLALRVGGSVMLLEACSSTVPALRPLSATLAAPASKGDRATVRLASPTGRRVDVLAIRVGGVALQMSPARPSVVGKATTAVQLTAPTTCPMQWQVAGFPSALTIDLTREPVGGGPPSPTAESSTAQLPIGLALTSWLAATSCGAAA